MTTDLHIPLLTDTYTKNQSAHRLSLIKELINRWLFDNQPGQDLLAILDQYLKEADAILHKDDPEWLKAVIPLIRDQIDPKKNLPKQSVELIKAVEKALSTERIISLYLPFEYNDEILKQYGLWFKTNVSKDCLIEPGSDPSLIGGCALAFNGIYHDYSIKAKIGENRSQILKQLLSFKKE